ncbi:hypothetical protein D3C87_1285550 [compost metagenome]
MTWSASDNKQHQYPAEYDSENPSLKSLLLSPQNQTPHICFYQNDSDHARSRPPDASFQVILEAIAVQYNP